jgi:RNA polymerase sigma-70 factor, ECF subfamily
MAGHRILTAAMLTFRQVGRHTGMDDQHESETLERLTRLWREAEPAVQAYVFSAVAGFQDAEDVVQQVALTAARQFDEYDPSRPFVAWALWLAKSRIVDHYRRQGRERLLFSEPLLDRLAEVLAERQPQWLLQHAAMEGRLDQLPEKSRQLLELRYVEGASAGIAAAAIESTAGAVRVML